MRPFLSIAIPVYKEMPNWEFFLERCLNSIRSQSFQDFEIVQVEGGKGMAGNTNKAIKASMGQYIKILYQDDYLAHKDALKRIVDALKANPESNWLITGCDNNEFPYYTQDIHRGNNKLGSPTVLTIKNEKPMLFDENLGWLLDCDYYRRMYDEHGAPIIVDGVEVILGIGEHQATNIMGDKIKRLEHEYMQNKYEN